MSDFGEHKLLILATLKELKEEQKELYQFLREHTAEEESNIKDISKRLQYLEHDHRWHIKIWSAAATILAVCTSFVLDYLKGR